MNAVDGSDHYTKTSDEPPPSHLTIILDTNPQAWALLSPVLPLSAAVSNILVFINAHLAFNNANQVAVVASHPHKAEFLYPAPLSEPQGTEANNSTATNGHNAEDTPMLDASSPVPTASSTSPADSNHYRPFQQIQRTLISSLKTLYNTTLPSSLPPTTSLAGALTLSLTHINKVLQKSSLHPTSHLSSQTAPDPTSASSAFPQTITPRILLLSVSGDLASQYIPVMNTIFACQRLHIPIDVVKITGDAVFLQQASDATGGTYMKLDEPRGLLQYLMMGFLADRKGREGLVMPKAVGVDFRAACFCHRRVLDRGWVCSVCLSIFCAPPDDAICLTCGTYLKMGHYGSKPSVVAKKKKKRKDK